MTKFFINYDKEKFQTMLLENYCIRAGIIPGTSKAAEELCRKLTAWLYGGGRFNSLLIFGGVGTGKTTLVEALFSTLRTLADMGVGFNLKMRVKAPQIANEGKLQDGLLDSLMETKGLIIYDLGSEAPVVKIYGSEWRPMETLIKRRSDDQLPTIVTTNLSLEQIERQYDSHRMADVLAQYDRITIETKSSFRRL